MFNKVMLMGRITARPDLRYTGSNVPYTRFTVAVNRYNEGTDFINVIVWKKQAENVCNYLDKGSRVFVEGSLSVSSYDDKDGNKRYTTDVMAQSVKFLDSQNRKEVSEEYEEENNYESDPYSEFGENEVNIDDNFLD